ncbi:MAG: hypothetical protein ACNY01_07785 [Desulfobacteria bacterium]
MKTMELLLIDRIEDIRSTGLGAIRRKILGDSGYRTKWKNSRCNLTFRVDIIMTGQSGGQWPTS